MKIAQKLALLALLSFTFAAAPMARAEQDETSMREPSAAKKKKKAKKGKAHKAKGKAKKSKAPRKSARKEAHAKTHAPSHAAPAGNKGVPDPYSDMPNEKKDDLPPPANTVPKDE